MSHFIFILSIWLIPVHSGRDNISDGMMTRETNVLSDAVMNALWFSQFYRPTSAKGKKQPVDELNAGKLAREYVHPLFANPFVDCSTA